MQSTWMFKPKYSVEVVQKVLKRICNYHLNWEDHGYEWTLRKAKCEQEGWLSLEVWPHENTQYFSETIFNEDPLTAQELTEDMLILLTDGPNAAAYKEDGPDSDTDWMLLDVELSDILASLSQLDTNIYSPYGDKVYCLPVTSLAGREPKRPALLDLLLTAAPA
tara:strand:- start:24 stop:515 length:492 start_codon:yes stop_codon:yes gene_type:complete